MRSFHLESGAILKTMGKLCTFLGRHSVRIHTAHVSNGVFPKSTTDSVIGIRPLIKIKLKCQRLNFLLKAFYYLYLGIKHTILYRNLYVTFNAPVGLQTISMHFHQKYPF